jgi:hypothetical protein
MNRSDYQLEVLVNNKPVKEYVYDSRIFIEGKEDTQYSLRFKNNSWHRVLVVLTIDGLNVITGKPGSVNDRGYIVNPYSSEIIDGWRISDKEVAKFFFSTPNKVYASKKGKQHNIGVIGCAVFEEKDHSFTMINNLLPLISGALMPVLWKPCLYDNVNTTWDNNNITNEEQTSCRSPQNNDISSSCFSMQEVASQDIGTGFGNLKHSEVINVRFDKQNNPSTLFVIHYNTREQLEKIGISFVQPQYINPSPFPKDDDYCIPPEQE